MIYNKERVPIMVNIAVFASGRGSNLQSIIDNIKNGNLNANIGFVLSNNSKSGALKRAEADKIKAIHFSSVKYSDEDEFALEMLNLLKKYSIDIIALAGYMKLVPSLIIKHYSNRILNIHPSLLPKYGGKGMYGMNVHKAVISNNEKETGVTVHYVTEEYDKGPVILQEKVMVKTSDTPESLAERVLKVENQIYPKALSIVTENL